MKGWAKLTGNAELAELVLPENKRKLNDYLWGKCEIEKAAHDVTGILNSDAQGGAGSVPPGGKVYLIPSSIKVGEIARILRESEGGIPEYFYAEFTPRPRDDAS